ncbi:MAG: GGDEF domain-containing phosphodiesterase [Pseudomonadota bacterium]
MSRTSVIKALPDIVLVVRRDGMVLDSLGGRTFTLDLAPDNMIGRRVEDVLPEPVARTLAQVTGRVLRSREAVTRDVQSDDERYEIRVSVHGRERVLAVLRDLSTQDGSATGRLLQPDRLVERLAGREKFVRALDAAVDEAKLAERMVAVICIALDDFDSGTASLDHNTVDELLRQAGERLCGVMAQSDAVPMLPGRRKTFAATRLERDQFCVMLTKIADAEQAEAFAESLGDALLPEYFASGQTLRIQPAIGLALFPQDGGNAEHVLGSAMSAMANADNLSRSGVERYSDSRRIVSERHQDLAEELRWAIDEHQLRLHYQPVFELSSANPIAIEAFLRWDHPLRGLITPQHFLPLAEGTGQIQRISEWVLRQACTDLKALRDQTDTSLAVSVNFSRHYFSRPDLVEHMQEIFAECDFDPCWLQLDITERMLMRTEYAGPLLARLKTLGIGLQIDDFGSGFSSLKRLRKLPLDALKIDGDFIAGIGRNDDDEMLCRAVISLAHAYGMRCVAEAVESREQVKFLRACGCDDIQGNLFGAEMPLDLVAIFLEQFQHGRSINAHDETDVVAALPADA